MSGRFSATVRRHLTARNAATLLVVVLLLGWLITLRPTFLGGATSYVIISGSSMEPTMSDCDLAIVRDRNGYEPGDVVAFRVPDGEVGEGLMVIHRIVGGTADEGFVTRGDNSIAEDRWRPRRDDVVGVKWVHIPNAGCAVSVLREPLVIGLIAGLFAALFILEADRFWKRDA